MIDGEELREAERSVKASRAILSIWLKMSSRQVADPIGRKLATNNFVQERLLRQWLCTLNTRSLTDWFNMDSGLIEDALFLFVCFLAYFQCSEDPNPDLTKDDKLAPGSDAFILRRVKQSKVFNMSNSHPTYF